MLLQQQYKQRFLSFLDAKFRRKSPDSIVSCSRQPKIKVDTCFQLWYLWLISLMSDCHLSNNTKLGKKPNTTCSRLQVENSHMLCLFFFSYIGSQKITRACDCPHWSCQLKAHRQSPLKPLPIILPNNTGPSLFQLHSATLWVLAWEQPTHWQMEFSSHTFIFQACNLSVLFGLFWLLMILKRLCHPTDPQQGFWHMSRFDDSCCMKQKSLQNILNISFNMFANCI